MCGIVAIRDWDNAGSADAVQSALDVLRHRGPDTVHLWQSPGNEICLGHTRLSIIDLATGDQPLTSEDGSLHIVVNGEFYTLLQDTVRGKSLERVPFRREGVIALLDSAAGADVPGKIAPEFPLMMTLSSCLLAERFGVSGGR